MFPSHTNTNGDDVLDRVVSWVETVSMTTESMEAIVDKQVLRTPAQELGLSDDWRGLKRQYNDDKVKAKLFTCLCSAWDIMLCTDETTKRQRKVDAQGLKVAIESSCKSFPPNVLKVVDEWVEGGDVRSSFP